MNFVRFRSFCALASVACALFLSPSLASSQAAKSAPAAAASAKAGPASAPAKGQLLDINSATPAQLKALPGVGDAYAKRIIDGRPYAAKTQLVSHGVLPQATYDKISGMIIARQNAK